MSSASGSPDENKPLPGLGFLTRRGWRTTGIVSVLVSAVMAWNGVAFIGAGWHWLALIAYWGTVIALVVVAVYTVLLDLRFTQLHYVLAEREIFLETLGSEEFRREIRRLAEKERTAASGTDQPAAGDTGNAESGNGPHGGSPS